MVQPLVRHGLLGELRVGFIGVGDKRDATRGEDPDAVDLAPFLEVAGDDFFNVVGDVDAADVEGAVLAHEAADAAHVVAVVAVFIAPETVDVGVEEVMQSGEPVQILAFVAPGTQPLCEKQTEVAACDAVATGISGVFGYIAAAEGGSFGQVLVFAVTAGPFVVPDVKDGASLRRGLGFHG